MANKIEIIETSLVVTDTITGDIIAEWPKRDIYFDTQKLNETPSQLQFYDTNSVNEDASAVFKRPLADCVESDGLTVFTPTTLRAFARVNLGFSSPAGGYVYGKTLTPAGLTGDVNDYSPTGWDNSIAFLRIDTGNNNRTITGLDSTGFRNGQSLFLANISSNRRITLQSNADQSAPQNRFISKGSTTLDNEEGILIVYDGISQRWRLDKAN